MASPEEGPAKDHWDKLHILLSPLGGLLTAIAVASLGFIGSRTVERQQAAEEKIRLYSELMTRREESEATLRKEMFQSIIGSFFDASTTSSLETKLLKMELLAENFHEALNLAPLFKNIHREIAGAALSPRLRQEYETRLSDLAREVTRKQMLVLESGGKRQDWTLLLSDSLLSGEAPAQLEDAELTLDGVKRRFRLTVVKADTAANELHVGLEVETPAQPGVPPDAVGRYSVEFDLGFYSTPMIDNTRLSNDQRAAVVLSDMNRYGASLSLMYFPGSRASLRDKPYYEEILRKLADTAGGR